MSNIPTNSETEWGRASRIPLHQRTLQDCMIIVRLYDGSPQSVRYAVKTRTPDHLQDAVTAQCLLEGLM